MELTVLKKDVQNNKKFTFNATASQGETIPLDYVMTPASGNADIPSAVALKVSATMGGVAVYTGAGVITDNVTSYPVALSIPSATTATLDGYYVASIKETHASYVMKAEGEITIGDSVEATP